VENHVRLSRGVQLVGATWRAAMKIVARVGDLVQRTGDGRISQILSSQTIERSDDVMCDLYCAHEDKKRGFLV
jgi:hypothetical protein